MTTEWKDGQIMQLGKEWEEIPLTPDGLIPESGTYLQQDGKYYIYRGIHADMGI